MGRRRWDGESRGVVVSGGCGDGELMRMALMACSFRSPPVKEIQLYPEEEVEEEIEVEPPVVVTSTKGAHPGDLSITPTTSEPLVNSSTTHQPPPSNDNPTDPISVERHRRRETLKSTLSALRAMYAGDEQEWKEVLREVGEGK